MDFGLKDKAVLVTLPQERPDGVMRVVLRRGVLPPRAGEIILATRRAFKPQLR